MAETKTREYCTAEVDGRVLTVTINRPDRMNALHWMANEELAAVFDEFVALKQTCGEDTSKFGYDKFAAKLRKNTASLLKKDGVVDVKFNVYIKDGKAALKAKVIKA